MAIKKETYSIVKDSIIFSISSFIVKFLSVIREFVIMRFVLPETYGLWQWFNMFVEYGRYSSLGTGFAMTKEYPYNVGKDNSEQAEKIKDTAFSFNLFTSLVSGIIVIIFAYVYPYKSKNAGLFKIGFFLTALVIILTQIFNYYAYYFRAAKKFKALSYSNLILSFSRFVLIVALVYFFHIYGIFIGMILAFLTVVAYVNIFHKPRVKWKIDRNVLKRLIKLGVPLIFMGIGFSLFVSIDKLMIMKMIGLRDLGLYGVAVNGVLLILYSRNILNTVLSAYTYQKYGEKEDVSKIKNYFEVPSKIAAYILPTIISFLFFLFPVFIKLALNKYAVSVMPAQILLLSSFFLAANFSSVLIVSMDKQASAFVIFPIIIILNAGLNYAAIKQGFGIVGVATATGISYFIYNLVFIIYTMRFYAKTKYILKFLAEIYFPMAVNAVVIFVLYRVELNFIINMAIMAILNVPFLIYIMRKEKLYVIFSNIVKEKFGHTPRV